MKTRTGQLNRVFRGRWGRRRLMGQKVGIWVWKKLESYFIILSNFASSSFSWKKWVKIKKLSQKLPLISTTSKMVFESSWFSTIFSRNWPRQSWIISKSNDQIFFSDTNFCQQGPRSYCNCLWPSLWSLHRYFRPHQI